MYMMANVIEDGHKQNIIRGGRARGKIGIAPHLISQAA